MNKAFDISSLSEACEVNPRGTIELHPDTPVTFLPISAADAWIAATALLYGVPLVTHNRKDFEGIDGLVVISEG